jgi:hypothetical protein
MITELVAVLAFGGLFALFGLLRPRAGCSSDPSSCGRCTGSCTRPRREAVGGDRGREEPGDPLLEVDR